MSFIKFITFNLLLTMRRPILFLSGLLSLMFLGFFLALIYMPGFHNAPMVTKVFSLTLGIGLMLIRWSYNELVFYFTPDSKEITLPL